MKSSNINFVARMQRWMDSVAGQTFLNYAYSWGASVVILGALFKLTHLPLANLMLYLGMGTEVLVFFISGFDRPFDKNDLAEVDGAADEAESDDTISTADETTAGSQPLIVVGGSQSSAVADVVASPELQAAAEAHGITPAGLADIVRMANDELLARAQQSMTPEMAQASERFIEQLGILTDTLERVEQQCARLTTDSEEMTNLNRTLTGINTVYELQLKGVSQQIGTIEQVNEQTRLMARQIEELNGVYARMIRALTVNMKNAANIAE